MGTAEDMDQFQLLEEKVDSLIKYIASLKKEKESLAEKLHIQEEKLTDLMHEVEELWRLGARSSRGLSTCWRESNKRISSATERPIWRSR